jgi:hypothetical protein
MSFTNISVSNLFDASGIFTLTDTTIQTKNGINNLVVYNEINNGTSTSINIGKNIIPETQPNVKLGINFGALCTNTSVGLQYINLIYATTDTKISYNSPNLKLVLKCNQSESGIGVSSQITLNNNKISFGSTITEENSYINASSGNFVGNVNGNATSATSATSAGRLADNVVTVHPAFAGYVNEEIRGTQRVEFYGVVGKNCIVEIHMQPAVNTYISSDVYTWIYRINSNDTIDIIHGLIAGNHHINLTKAGHASFTYGLELWRYPANTLTTIRYII